ncbi:MAG: hypothetical protein L0Y43_09575 [Methylococcaceae bacterium]|nr:hypothetical protein [Methylococcaceae bacterium]
MKDTNCDLCQEVALFRYGLIADLVHPALRAYTDGLKRKPRGITGFPGAPAPGWPPRRCVTG